MQFAKIMLQCIVLLFNTKGIHSRQLWRVMCLASFYKQCQVTDGSGVFLGQAQRPSIASSTPEFEFRSLRWNTHTYCNEVPLTDIRRLCQSNLRSFLSIKNTKVFFGRIGGLRRVLLFVSESAQRKPADKHQELGLFRSRATEASATELRCCKFAPVPCAVL
jgi:hypothetical protein